MFAGRGDLHLPHEVRDEAQEHAAALRLRGAQTLGGNSTTTTNNNNKNNNDNHYMYNNTNTKF